MQKAVMVAWGHANRVRTGMRGLGMVPPLVVLVVAFQVLSGGRFLTLGNIGVLLDQAAVNMVLGAGMTFVVLAGGIDLSVSSILAAAVIAGLTASNIAGLAVVWPVASLAVGSACGMLNGLLVFRLRLPPFILTLASMTIVLGVARAITGDTTIDNVALPYVSLGSSAVFGMPVLAGVGLAMIVGAWFVLTRTVIGVSIYAVGGNEAVARLSGIDVFRVYLVAYGVSGLTAGVGAVMVASKLHGANALQVGQSYTLDAITAVVLGGTSIVGGIGSVWGTLIGALIIVVLSNGLIIVGVSDMWQSVIKGAVIIGAVTLDRVRPTASVRA